MPAAPDPPRRFKDRHLQVVSEWRGGCLICGSADLSPVLPPALARVGFPLCDRHLRWAMASRRERMGRQARNLKLLLLAWCRLNQQDRQTALDWLGY